MTEHLQRAEPDLLRSMLSTFVQALMSAEADAICGAGYGERSPERTNSRNGYRTRDFDTRTGTMEVAIPKLRKVGAGAKRSYSDALKLQGEDNTSSLAAVVRRAVMWQRGARTNTGAMRPTPLEMNLFIDEHPQIRTSAEIASKMASFCCRPASSGCVTGCSRTSTPRARRGSSTERRTVTCAEDPIAALRNRIVKMRVGGGRVNETDALALVIMAWNTHRAGERRSKLQMPRGGLTPENFPEPR
jgi:hypothetical protein